MSTIIANYKIPCQDLEYCSFSSFLMIMVALLRRSSVSILFLLTNVPLRRLQQCWFRDSVKYSGSTDSCKAIKGRRTVRLWLSGITLASWELASMQVSCTGKLQNKAICFIFIYTLYIFNSQSAGLYRLDWGNRRRNIHHLLCRRSKFSLIIQFL